MFQWHRFYFKTQNKIRTAHAVKISHQPIDTKKHLFTKEWHGESQLMTILLWPIQEEMNGPSTDRACESVGWYPLWSSDASLAHSRCHWLCGRPGHLRVQRNRTRQGQIRQAGCVESPHWRGKRMWSSEAKVILRYKVNFKSAWDTQDPVSKKFKTKQNNHSEIKTKRKGWDSPRTSAH